MIHWVEAGYATHPDLNAAVGEWISMQLWGRSDRGPRDFSTLAVFRDDTLIAGVAYHDWHPREGVIEMTVAAVSPRWLTKPVLKRLFGFPFQQLGCQLVVWRVSARNAHVLDLARRQGFSLYQIPRMLGRHEDGVVCTYTDDAWNDWLSQHGQIGPRTA